MIEYRRFHIRQENTPIGRYSWSHQDYDGPGDTRCGHSWSLNEAKEEIDDMLIDCCGDCDVPLIENCLRCGGPNCCAVCCAKEAGPWALRIT